MCEHRRVRRAMVRGVALTRNSHDTVSVCVLACLHSTARPAAPRFLFHLLALILCFFRFSPDASHASDETSVGFVLAAGVRA